MRLLKILVNWLMFITAPLWSGFVLPFCISKEIINNIGTTRQVMAGKDWIWRIK